MNSEFAEYVTALPLLTERLRNSAPLTTEQIATLKSPGIYCFSEGEDVLYLGRTTNFRVRHKSHCHETSGETKAAFAFRLARQKTDQLKASYKKEGGRKALMLEPTFLAAFNEAKLRIRDMDVRFVEVPDPIMQYLLELYASMEFKSTHNSFKTS